ncbi:MAG: hypothetical protein K5859_03480 [Atopobiaceae bacterium]|nr:hypothetical protein [Atopobiaceae bacterium]
MSRGLTIADLVQQVLYAVYKVRLDVDESVEGSFHCHSDKFKEVVMEANFVLQEFQKEQDWSFLRERWEIGPAMNPPVPGGIQEIPIPDVAYKVCTGYGDAVRLHRGFRTMQIPFEEARTGNRRHVEMFDEWGELNVDTGNQRAFTVGDILTFNRPWFPGEMGGRLETDVIRYIEPLHICDSSCPAHCPKAYDERILTWMPDPYYIVVRTAAKRAEGDPSVSERVQSLTDEGSKLLSAIRENDSAHTVSDTYDTAVLGYVPVL